MLTYDNFNAICNIVNITSNSIPSYKQVFSSEKKIGRFEQLEAKDNNEDKDNDEDRNNDKDKGPFESLVSGGFSSPRRDG